MLSIALLGPLEVIRDGEHVHVPRGRASELLVRLALEPGALVSADRLLQDLWAETAAETRRNTLQAKVAMLRRALGPTVVASRDSGYALMVEAGQVDAWMALRQTTSAVRLREAGDAQHAAEVTSTCLKLFRGEVLSGAGDAEWVGVHRTRLEEARLTLLEVHYWARLSLGDLGTVVGELEAAVVAHPFQESLWELLITALYRAGRQADALAAYQRVRKHLADELGLDPGPELQLVEQRILAQDASIGAPTRAAEHDLRRPVGNLPTLSAGLVDRQQERVEVLEALPANRLVEIIGPGGVGKTALALDVARRLLSTSEILFDGVWLARLESAITPADVLDTLVAALDVPGEAAVFERLRHGTNLVILDNCEHVPEAVSALVVRLLDSAPNLRILCTSQIRLDLDGEHVVELAPLAPADAAELFIRRATAQRLSFETDGVNQSVLDLCRSLDGLPLAIELAAARTRTLTVEEITRRLDDRFTVLRDPTSHRSERLRSLKATIQWSYELLFPDDQRGLWALATFAGGATMDAAERVLEALEVPPSMAIDVIDRLVARGLVIVDDERTPGPGPHTVRYRLLDSIRAFALEALGEAGLSSIGLAAHAQWLADVAAGSTRGVRSAQQAEHLAFARAERANIDAALAWGAEADPLLALNLARGFGWAWVVLGDSRGAQRLLAALDAVGDLAAPADRAEALLLAGWIEASSGHLEPAQRHVDLASKLAGSIDDVDLRARCSYYLAYVVSHHGEWDHALELTERSAALYEGLDRPWDQAANALFAARAAISAGYLERATTETARAQTWLRATDDPWLRVRGDAVLGELARIQHRFNDAVVYLATAAETSRRLGFLQTEAYQLSMLGRAQCQAGDYPAGTATLQVAIDRAEATGDVRLAALARVHLGRVLRATGRLEDARSNLETASRWHRRSGGGEQAALGECLLAAMDAADHVPGARERLLAHLAEARTEGSPHVEVFALDALARLALYDGDVPTAANLIEEADRRMSSASHFITELDRVDADAVRHAL